jgi:hypothetical protein
MMAERLPRAGRNHATSQQAALVSCNALLGGFVFGSLVLA